MGKVNAVAVAASKEVEEENAASFGDEGVSESVECYAGCADAVDEEDLLAGCRAEFIDSYCTVLWTRQPPSSLF